MSLEHVKIGDYVWEGSQPLGQFFPKQWLKEVVAVTPKGFRIRGSTDLYKKETGQARRGSTYKFHAIATPAEVEEWKTKQEALRLEREAHNHDEARRSALRAELSKGRIK